jgi:ligand-binding sensor domain-containing protein/DNA-binding NarL/FixJ family response regulator
MRSRLWLIVFVLGVSGLFGQTFSSIDGRLGLNHPTVYDIEQDPWGFVWIGTRDGLYKFNEGRANQVSFLDSTDLRRSNNVQSLLVSQDSILFIGLQLGGLIGYDLSTMSIIPDDDIPQLPKDLSVISLFQSNKGTLWAGTAGAGIYYLNPSSNRWNRLIDSKFPNELFFCFDFAQQGDTIWLATTGGALLYVTEFDLAVHEMPANADVGSYRKSVDVFRNKVAYGVEDQGLFILDSLRSNFIQYEALENFWPRDVKFIGRDLWVSTDGEGLFKISENRISHFSKNEKQSGLASNQFYGIYALNNEVWLGTFNAGIAIIPESEELIVQFPRDENYANTSVQSAISLIAENGIWVGYDGDGLKNYKQLGGRWDEFMLFDDRYPKVITSLIKYRDELWIGSLSEGIYVIDQWGKIKRRYSSASENPLGLSNSNIWSMQKTWGDSLWIGTLSGLQFWDGSQFVTPFEGAWDAGRNIMDLEFDGKKLWVGSEFEGLFSLDRTGTLERFALDNSVLDLHEYQNNLIIATEGAGILALRNGVIDTVIDNERYMNAYSLASLENDLFATTSIGLLRLYLSAEGDWKYEVLRELDQLQVGSPNRKSLVSMNGRLYVGGTKGVAELNVQKMSVSDVPDIIMTSVLSDNLRIPFNVTTNHSKDLNQVVFEPGVKSIRFNFELVSTQLRSGINTSYRIKQLDKSWKNIAYGLRSIDLSELNHGSYTLEIQAVGSNNNYTTLIIPFKIESFLWQRTWFQVMCLLLLISAIVLSVYVYQDRKFQSTRLQLVEMEKELLKSRAAELEVKTEKQKAELSFQLLKTSSRLELLKGFKDRLIKESQKKGLASEVMQFLKSLTRELNRELQSENYWDHFERNYRELHEEFSANLKKTYPDLTKGEIRLSYLLRQKMSNKEVANVLNVSPAAVEKAKYRLKKKLGIDKGSSLDNFIQDL